MIHQYTLAGGTAGLLGFVPADRHGLKATAIPADAHPSQAGLRVLSFVRQLVKDRAEQEATERIGALRLVRWDVPPDADDVNTYRRWAAPGTNLDWPVTWPTLLARTAGDPDAIMTAGVMVDAHDFAADSLHCQWGYVINFRHRVLEVYRGLTLEPPTDGRWVGEEAEERAVREQRRRETGRDYYAVNRVAEFPFDQLPTDEAFLTHLDHLL